MDADERYARARSLAAAPSEAAVEELVAMLSDDGSFYLDDGCSLFDRDPTEAFVREAAAESLGSMVELAWPAVVAALPDADGDTARAMLNVLGRLKPEQLAELPPSAHWTIALAAASLGLVDRARAAEWERDHPRRNPDPEAFWRERLGHPDESHRAYALIQLARTAADPAALVAHLVGSLEHDVRPWAPLSWNTVIAALNELPLPSDVVRRLAGSELVRKHERLLPVLAKYGADAAAIAPVCVDMLQHQKIGDYVPWTPQNHTDPRRWSLASEALVRLGEAAAPVRAPLVERLLATNEQMSLLGSLRFRLIDALGDPARLLAEISDRLDAMAASPDVVESNRAKQIRDYVEARIARP